MPEITVRIFASHPVVMRQYSQLLAAEKNFHLVSEEEAFQVGVFDAESTSVETVLTLARLKFPMMRPVLVSTPCSDNECLRWLFRGAWGLVTYDRYREELPRAVRQLASGQLWFSAPVVVRWMRIDAARRSTALEVSLTRRERQIMDLLLRRFSNREIAEILNISERTVKFHVGNVLSKLHVHSRKELVASRVPHLGLT
jgi:DNA-binding NarL/FixJ family response regulator